jgi:C4-dicarboxylate-specific signal transduction histidine kinase
VAATVRELAEVARPGPVSATRVALPDVLETAVTLASSKLANGVQVVRELGPVPAVMANGAQLAQVFLHLLVNAAQAVAATSGRGKVHVVTRTDERGRAVVEVREDWPSLDGAAREHVEKAGTRAVGVQAGLGLAVCDGIVLGLGGVFEVENEAGCGSLHRVVLPAASSPAAVPGWSSDSAGPPDR